jgi:hypothetical protein
LKDGPAHRFSEFRTLHEVVTRAGAGVYTIWDENGVLVYVGPPVAIPTGPDSMAVCTAKGRDGAAATSSASTRPIITYPNSRSQIEPCSIARWAAPRSTRTMRRLNGLGR